MLFFYGYVLLMLPSWIPFKESSTRLNSFSFCCVLCCLIRKYIMFYVNVYKNKTIRHLFFNKKKAVKIFWLSTILWIKRDILKIVDFFKSQKVRAYISGRISTFVLMRVIMQDAVCVVFEGKNVYVSLRWDIISSTLSLKKIGTKSAINFLSQLVSWWLAILYESWFRDELWTSCNTLNDRGQQKNTFFQNVYEFFTYSGAEWCPQDDVALRFSQN